jgi:hypothetical protein
LEEFVKEGMTEGDVRAAMAGVSLSNKKKDGKGYQEYEDALRKEIKDKGGKFIKATPFYKKGVKSPAGYVIETDKETMVSYHGTQFGKFFGSGGKEVFHDLQMQKSKMKFGDQECGVHAGFKKEYDNSRDDLYSVLQEVKGDPAKPVIFSGHSLGGAVANIAALDASANNRLPNGQTVGGVVTFGAPRVLSPEAAQVYNDKGLDKNTLRVKQGWDVVPRIPSESLGYAHVGKKVKLDAGMNAVHSGKVYRKMSRSMSSEAVSEARNSRPINLESCSIRSYAFAMAETVKGTLLKGVSMASKVMSSLRGSSKTEHHAATQVESTSGLANNQAHTTGVEH